MNLNCGYYNLISLVIDESVRVAGELLLINQFSMRLLYLLIKITTTMKAFNTAF